MGAHELARRGKAFTWLTDGKAVGGHFAGIDIGETAFDIGMVLLEKSRGTGEYHSLVNFDPRIRNDWVRFGPLASRWMDELCDTIKAPTPYCLVGDREVPDYLIANRLDAVCGKTGIRLALDRPRMTRQDPRHPAFKLTAGPYDYLSYEDAATLSHGGDFHFAYIEPFVRKVLGVSSSQFLARYHRVAWAPIYYPETLAAAARGEPTGLDEYPFWTTATGRVCDLVRGLRKQVMSCRSANVVERSIESVKPDSRSGWHVVADGQEYGGSILAMGLVPDRACALLGIAPAHLEAASVAIGFFLVHEEVIRRSSACLMVVDDSHGAYRVTDQDAAAGRQVPWHRVTLEASPVRLTTLHPAMSLNEAMEQELLALLGTNGAADNGASRVRNLRCMIATNALTLPTAFALQESARVHAALTDKMPGIALTASLLPFGMASFNDQVIQGLKFAEEWA